MSGVETPDYGTLSYHKNAADNSPWYRVWTLRGNISLLIQAVHTRQEKLDNAALFPWPHLSVTKTELFENALQTGGKWKRRLFVFVWRENISKTEFFENDGVTIIMWFPWPNFSSVTNTWLVIVAFSNSSGVVWTEYICCVFRVKRPFLNSSGWRSTEGPSVNRWSQNTRVNKFICIIPVQTIHK